MIRTCVFFLILAILVVLTAWVAEHPGAVFITFGEYRLHTSVGFLVVAAGSLAFAITLSLIHI